MIHPSPYAMLRKAQGLYPTGAEAEAVGPAWTDLQALAAHWSHLQARPNAAPASYQPAERPYAAQAISAQAAGQSLGGEHPSNGPRMRMPPPMYPPTSYPTSGTLYGVPSTPGQPTRHAYYDSIIQQHKNAAQNAVFMPAAME